jgi:hypothetical protein
VKRLLALIVAVVVLGLPAICHATHSAITGMPSEAQSLARRLWGCPAMDFWTATCTVKDTLDVTFIFLDADSSDTLSVTPQNIMFQTSVACTVSCVSDTTLWIDRAKIPVEAGAAMILPIRAKGISVIMSGAGRCSAWAFAN